MRGIPRRRISRRSFAAGLAALVTIALLAGCGGSSKRNDSESSAPPAAGPQLTELRTTGEFRSLFNDAKGKPRVVLLLSPT